MAVRKTFGMARAITAGTASAALLLGFVWGVAAERYEWFPHAQAKAALRWLAPQPLALRIGHNDSAGRTALDCRTLAGNTVALLAFGQSNAANSGDVPYPGRPRGVYNFNIVDSRCYEGIAASGHSKNLQTEISIWVASQKRRLKRQR